MWEKAPAIVAMLAWLALYFFELTTGRLQRAGFAHQQVMAFTLGILVATTARILREKRAPIKWD